MFFYRFTYLTDALNLREERSCLTPSHIRASTGKKNVDMRSSFQVKKLFFQAFAHFASLIFVTELTISNIKFSLYANRAHKLKTLWEYELH